jgi:hypothetical protein
MYAWKQLKNLNFSLDHKCLLKYAASRRQTAQFLKKQKCECDGDLFLQKRHAVMHPLHVGASHKNVCGRVGTSFAGEPLAVVQFF